MDVHDNIRQDTKQKELDTLKSKRTAAVQKRIEERVRAGLCVHQDADGTECQRKMHSRGLCLRHFAADRYEFRDMTPAQREAIERELERIGQKLGANELRQLRRVLFGRGRAALIRSVG